MGTDPIELYQITVSTITLHYISKCKLMLCLNVPANFSVLPLEHSSMVYVLVVLRPAPVHALLQINLLINKKINDYFRANEVQEHDVENNGMFATPNTLLFNSYVHRL